MANLDARQPSKMYRGTIEEVFKHGSEIPAGTTVELRVFDGVLVPFDDSDVFDGKSLADMIKEIGTVKGLPVDLAANPIHMNGFGDTNTRRSLEP